MKGFLIDPVAKTVTRIEIEPGKFLEAAYRLIGCELVECVNTPHLPGADLWMDEEARLRDDAPERGFWLLHGYDYPMIGRAIVMATDKEGETISCKTMPEDLALHIAALDTIPVAGGLLGKPVNFQFAH